MAKDEKDDVVMRVEVLVARLQKEYADDPNVTAVGWGLARRAGDLEDGVSLIFYVKKKYGSARSAEAAGSRPIPGEIEGFLTDVQEMNLRPSQATGSRDETKYDPLRGGPATSNSEEHIAWFNGFGTLGVLGRDNTDGSPVGLSNWHVWADGGEEGDQIIQPAHPTGAEHVEAITKVAACGPLITSLIEWEAPSPLTAGLYGAAAATAIAAAASDYRDPTRRGQDATPTDPGERTEKETVRMAVEYADLPVPGIPFRTEVKWAYTRETDRRVLRHDAEEARVNTQFLLGKMVAVDRTSYQPGSSVKLTAALWDYQPRPCDAYHVVAHLIPRNRPNEVVRVVLSPTACPRSIPLDPPKTPGAEPAKETCLDFEDQVVGQYPYKGNFAWLSYHTVDQVPASIQDWFNGDHALVVVHGGIMVWHAPATKVTARIAQFTDEPVRMKAFGTGGQVIGDVTAPNQQGVVHELSVAGAGILGARFSGGGGEGLILSYCVELVQATAVELEVSEVVRAGIVAELPKLRLHKKRRLKASRCCFTGTCRIPPGESPGRWDVHLTVQNVNTVGDGTEPEEAATVIGGHVLSAHASVSGCAAIMLADHAFDVI